MSKNNDNIFSVSYNYSGKKAVADIRFRPEMLTSDNSEYNPDIACFSAVLSMAGYDLPYGTMPIEEAGIFRFLTEIGMESIRFDTGTDSDEVDGIFASMHTETDGKSTALICICFVGSHHGQWYTNFESGTDKLHKSFEICGNNEYKKLEAYVNDVLKENERIVFLITGHSRGGAIAGIIASRLVRDEKYADSSDVFAYTFASPAYVRITESNENPNCIFNFINEEDFVVRCMPEKWGYTRYGTTISLPNSSNSVTYDEILKKANSYYSGYTAGNMFYPFKKGTKAVDKVANSICVNVPDIKGYYNKKFRTPAGKMSLEEFFQKSLCVVTAEISDPEKSKPGTMLLLKSSALRFRSSPVIRTVSDFFIIYEGLSGAVKGNLFRNYFSSTHDMCTYCALLMAVTENDKEQNYEV